MEVTQTSEPPGPAIYAQAPAYVYPGYMFGPPIYNVNGKCNSPVTEAVRHEASKGSICTIFKAIKCVTVFTKLDVFRFCGLPVSVC